MKSQLSNTRALLIRLRKELNGKLECSVEAKRDLELLIAEIEQAHQEEVSKAKASALISKSLVVLGTLVKLLPEVAKYFGDAGG